MVYVQLFDALRRSSRHRRCCSTPRMRRADRRRARLSSSARAPPPSRTPCRAPADKPKPHLPTCSPTRASLALLAAARPDRARAAALPQAARRQAAGRPLLAASRAMTEPIDYRHVSILWAAPEHAAELAELHAACSTSPGTPRAFRGCSAIPGSTSFLARVGHAAADGGLHPRPARGRRGGDPDARRAQGVPAARHRPAAGRGAWPRRQEGRGAAAVSRGRRGQRGCACALQGLGFQEVGRRKGYYQRPGRPPRTRSRWRSTFEPAI